MHSQLIVEGSGKPEIIMCYNHTKEGLNTFTQICATYSCSRKTNRCSVCILCGLMNEAVIKSWIIYRENRLQTRASIPINSSTCLSWLWSW